MKKLLLVTIILAIATFALAYNQKSYWQQMLIADADIMTYVNTASPAHDADFTVSVTDITPNETITTATKPASQIRVCTITGPTGLAAWVYFDAQAFATTGAVPVGRQFSVTVTYLGNPDPLTNSATKIITTGTGGAQWFSTANSAAWTVPKTILGAPTGIEVETPPAVGETIVGDGTNGFAVGVVITGGGIIPHELLGGDILEDAILYTITATGTQDVVVHKPAAYVGEWYCWMLKGGVLTPAVPNPLGAAESTYTFTDVDFDAKGDAQIILNDNPTLPVEFSSFAATLTAQNFVKLTWVTETETGVSGYNVYRSTDANQASAVKINANLIDANNTSSTQTYSHIDNEVAPETTYSYWLEIVEMDGTTAFHGPTNVYVEAGQPVTPSLISTMGNAYPNPFKANSNTNIAYEVKAGETGTITIYNIIGQVVKTVPVSETTTPRTFTWNGRDSKGNVCGSGIYFYKLSTPSRNITKKMVIVN